MRTGARLRGPPSSADRCRPTDRKLARSELLLTLAEPATSSGLARRQRLSASVVSSHLGALRRAGLARSHRSGREVWYEVTPLGQALVTAAARA